MTFTNFVLSYFCVVYQSLQSKLNSPAKDSSFLVRLLFSEHVKRVLANCTSS